MFFWWGVYNSRAVIASVRTVYVQGVAKVLDPPICICILIFSTLRRHFDTYTI